MKFVSKTQEAEKIDETFDQDSINSGVLEEDFNEWKQELKGSISYGAYADEIVQQFIAGLAEESTRCNFDSASSLNI